MRPDTGTWRHVKALSGAADTGSTGPGIEGQKNAVSALLLTEILIAVMKHNTGPQRVYVLDLFAGYGSMKVAAKELGLSYAGVDERDLASRAWPAKYPERHPRSSEFYKLLVRPDIAERPDSMYS